MESVQEGRNLQDLKRKNKMHTLKCVFFLLDILVFLKYTNKDYIIKTLFERNNTMDDKNVTIVFKDYTTEGIIITRNDQNFIIKDPRNTILDCIPCFNLVGLTSFVEIIGYLRKDLPSPVSVTPGVLDLIYSMLYCSI